MKEEMDFDSGYGLERLKTYAEFKYEIYKLLEQNRKLENNWKELKKYIEKEINDWDNKFVTADRPNECAIASIILDKTLFKMQEIERGKNEENS